MRKGKDLSNDLDRLVAASAMFAFQQSERATLGDDEDYDDAKRDTHGVVGQVLDTLEKNLDEDLLEQLDRGEYPRMASAFGCWPRLPDWRSTWPYSKRSAYRGRVVARPLGRDTRRTHDMLDEILEDFRADFESRLRQARREDRALSETELDETLQELRQDLSVVVRRSKRREDRREEETHTSNGRTRVRDE
jgi:hypothetical protein